MTIKLYGTITCPGCIQAKKWLEENNIDYEYETVGETLTTDEFFDKFRFLSVPVLEIDKNNFIRGFNEEKYREAIPPRNL